MEGRVKKPCQMSIKQPPDNVLKIWEEEVEKNWNGKISTVSRESILKRLYNLVDNRKDIFDNNWLDIEETFEANGWKVWQDDGEDYWYFEAKEKEHPIPKGTSYSPPIWRGYSPPGF